MQKNKLNRNKSIKLDVVIPFYNQNVTTLYKNIKKIKKYLIRKNISSKIIISQNGSSKKLKISQRNIILVFDERKGLGCSIKNYLKIAKGEFFYFTSPDMPFNFSDLNRMLPNINKFDLIIGSKLLSQSVYKINYLRKAISHLQSIFAPFFLKGFPVHDPNGTFIGKLKSIKNIGLKVKSDDFFFATELIYLASKKALKIKEVPVKYVKLDNYSTVKLIRDGFQYFKQLFFLSLTDIMLPSFFKKHAKNSD